MEAFYHIWQRTSWNLFIVNILAARRIRLLTNSFLIYRSSTCHVYVDLSCSRQCRADANRICLYLGYDLYAISSVFAFMQPMNGRARAKCETQRCYDEEAELTPKDLSMSVYTYSNKVA